MRLDALQKPFMGRVVLHDSVRRWWLASPLQTNVDWNAKRQRISRTKEALMARIIEFYVPAKFQRRKPLIAQSHKGKVVVFCAEAKKPA
jgi:hypothetical protein